MGFKITPSFYYNNLCYNAMGKKKLHHHKITGRGIKTAPFQITLQRSKLNKHGLNNIEIVRTQKRKFACRCSSKVRVDI